MQIRLFFPVGLLIVAMPGCHGGYPHGYYAPGPSIVPQQPSTYPSGPIYQPGGTYMAPPAGAPYVPGTVPGTVPGSVSPTPIYPPSTPGNNSTYDTPSGSGNSPNFNPETPSGRKTVPEPEDDPGYERGTNRPALTPTSRVEPDEETPFSQSESRRRPEPYDSPSENVADSEPEWEAPSIRQTSNFEPTESGVDFADSKTEVKRTDANVYGHDPEFRWVQGVVDYDADKREWAIIYDQSPDETDALGGILTIADHPDLARLRTGDTIRIKGSLDNETGDSRNLPVFRMQRFERIR